MNENIISQASLVANLKAMGVQEGDLLNLKISYKSIGKIENGVKGIIDACLEAVGPNGTIFSDSFVSPYPRYKMLLSPKKCLTDDTTKSYAGAIANVMVSYPNAKRSPHPIQKFVAIGKDADMVLRHDVGSRPYSLLHEMALKGGKNIRIGPSEKVTGVGTTHVAIELLGLKQNILHVGVCYYNKNGELKRFYHSWPTACTVAFNNLLDYHREKGGILCEGKVGNSEAILSDMKTTLENELTLLKDNPQTLHCHRDGCQICNLNWQFSSGNLWNVLKANGKQKKYKRMILILYQYIFKNYQPKDDSHR